MKLPRPLSPTRLRLLLWLAGEAAAGRGGHGDAAIMAGVGYASRASLQAGLEALEADGWIARSLGTSLGPRPGRRTIAILRDPSRAMPRTPKRPPPLRPRKEEAREKNPAVRAQVVRLYRAGTSLRGCADRCGFPSGGTAVIRRILRTEKVAIRTRQAPLRASTQHGHDPRLPWPKVERRPALPPWLFTDDPAAARESFVYARGFPSTAAASSLTGCSAASCADAA